MISDVYNQLQEILNPLNRTEISLLYSPTNLSILSRLQCKDGFNISMQASKYHYCSPRDDVGPYTHVELGFPSEAEELLITWAEDATNLTGSVYSNVPLFVVSAIVLSHGGLEK